MDFLLKKFVSMFLMPLPLGVAFIILGLIFLYRNKIAKNNKKPYLRDDSRVIEKAAMKGNLAGQVNLATAGYHNNQEIRNAYTSPSEVRKGNTGTAGSKGGILAPQKSLKQKYGMRK